ncbi:MAG: ATP-binding protein [Sedimentisphaerales bacterium]|nr:ATP-binding protein [Sedimentisphaerales bacterium]
MSEKNEGNSFFLTKLGRTLNAGQSKIVALTGNILDLFFSEKENDYVPIKNFLLSNWNIPEMNKWFILAVYELNKPVEFLNDKDRDDIKKAWVQVHTRYETDPAIARVVRPFSVEKAEKQAEENFESDLRQTAENSIFALEFLRQLCLVSRVKVDGKQILNRDLIILVEGADLLIPQGDASRLSETDRRKIAICRDWFCDPEFMNGRDSVIFIAESRSRLNEEVSHLPQLLEVEIPSPDEGQRDSFISWFIKKQPEDTKTKFREGGSMQELAGLTAGLSIHALMQLLKEKSYSGERIEESDIIIKVSDYIVSQLGGEDVVEFYRPKHKLSDVVGNVKLVKFLKEKFIPRIKLKEGCISGAIVCGPIGSGKTFIFEAVAADLGIPVLVLKNLRSKWFGETDVIFERLRRCLESLGKALIFVDEADTQFGGVSQDVHETERRLTGKIQAMMSNPVLKGKIVWLLMTARISQLSPDIRRPGRCGDFIIPVLDPVGEDLKAFISFVLKPVMKNISEQFLSEIARLTEGYYAASFACLKDDLISYKISQKGRELSENEIKEIILDRILNKGGKARRMQELNALLNCSHRSLLPCAEDVELSIKKWEEELKRLESLYYKQ